MYFKLETPCIGGVRKKCDPRARNLQKWKLRTWKEKKKEEEEKSVIGLVGLSNANSMQEREIWEIGDPVKCLVVVSLLVSYFSFSSGAGMKLDRKASLIFLITIQKKESESPACSPHIYKYPPIVPQLLTATYSFVLCFLPIRSFSLRCRCLQIYRFCISILLSFSLLTLVCLDLTMVTAF